jgi:hypothetical protein
MQMLQGELDDKQQLRRALSALVDAVFMHVGRAELPEQAKTPLDSALQQASQALDDTSHEGWLRRMRQQKAALSAARFAECQANGRHLEVLYTSDEPPRCTHCERDVRAPLTDDTAPE